MTKVARLSGRAYGRLSPERKKAADILQYGTPTPAERGQAKTVLGWRRTREETIAYARRLLDDGVGRLAVADQIGVSDDYLQKVLDLEKPGRNPSAGAEKSGLTDSPKVIPHPDRRPGYLVYGGDPFAYQFEAAIRGSA